MMIQLTGLSGAGKTTISQRTCTLLEKRGIRTMVIDGDVFRSGLCKDLGFSRADRIENIRRLGMAAKGQLKNYDVVIIAAINPFEESRNALIQLYDAKTVWLQCDLSTLMARDHKGLYCRAMLPDDHPEKVHEFSGISQEYEIPVHAHLIINTGETSAEEASQLLTNFIAAHYLGTK